MLCPLDFFGDLQKKYLQIPDGSQVASAMELVATNVSRPQWRWIFSWQATDATTWSCSMLNQTKHQFLGFLLLQNTCHCLMAVEIWDLIVCVSSARLNWYPQFRCNLTFVFFSQDMFQGVRAGFRCSRHRWAPQCSTSNRRVWKLLRVASFWVSDLMFKNVAKSKLLVETVSKAFAFWKLLCVLMWNEITLKRKDVWLVKQLHQAEPEHCCFEIDISVPNGLSVCTAGRLAPRLTRKSWFEHRKVGWLSRSEFKYTFCPYFFCLQTNIHICLHFFHLIFHQSNFVGVFSQGFYPAWNRHTMAVSFRFTEKLVTNQLVSRALASAAIFLNFQHRGWGMLKLEFVCFFILWKWDG